MKKLRKFMACIIVASLVISLMPAAFAAGIEPYVENAVNTVISTGFDWDTAVYPDSLGSDQSIYYAHKLALGKAWGFTYGVDVKSGTSTLDCAKGLGGKMVDDTSVKIVGTSSQNEINVTKYFDDKDDANYYNSTGIVTAKFKLYSDSQQYLKLRCIFNEGVKDLWIRASENEWTDHIVVIDLDNAKYYVNGGSAADLGYNKLRGFRFIFTPENEKMLAFDDLSITYCKRGAETLTEDTVTLSGVAATGSEVKAYVNGDLNSNITTTGMDYAISVNGLKQGRNIVTVEVKAPNGEISSYTKIISVTGVKTTYIAGTTKTMDFNDLPEITDARDAETFNTLKAMYGITSPANDATMFSKTSGASGSEDDYALYVKAYPGWKPRFTVGGDASYLVTSGKVVYDFDFKTDNSNDEYWLLATHNLWHNQNKFIGSGYLYDPYISIPSNKWVHFNMVYDLTEANGNKDGGKWYVTTTIDGVSTLIVNGKTTVSNVYKTGYGFDLNNRSSGNFVIDNFSITNIFEAPYVSSVDYMADGTAYETNAVVPANAESITFNMSGAVTLTDGCLTLNGEAVASDKISLDASAKSVTIQLSSLKAESKLSFAGLVNADITVTDDKGYYCVPEINGTSYTAKIYGMAPDGSESITVVIASYDEDNSMVSVDVKKVNVGAGSFVNSISSTIDAKATSTKTMIIDSIGNIVPLTKNR